MRGRAVGEVERHQRIDWIAGIYASRSAELDELGATGADNQEEVSNVGLRRRRKFELDDRQAAHRKRPRAVALSLMRQVDPIKDPRAASGHRDVRLVDRLAA